RGHGERAVQHPRPARAKQPAVNRYSGRRDRNGPAGHPMLKARPIPPAVAAEQARTRPAPTYWIARLREDAFGYALLAPALLVILGLNLYPTISGFITSFTNESLLNPNAWNWVG